MKLKLYKTLFVFVLAIGTTTFAQKQSKKYTETFNVNKNIEVEIEASNAEIDVTTWNKNQVYVEAIIEIEGLSKKQANKYLKNYKFEALGNKSKVKVYSTGNSSFKFDNDFVFFGNDFKMPEIVIPDIEIPEMDFDFDFDFGSIVIPEIDMGKIFMDIDDIEFDWDAYKKDGKDYFFKWKNGVKEITIKSKEDWEKFKKSKEYKEWKADMKKESKKIHKEVVEMTKKMKLDKEMMKKELKKAAEQMKKVDMPKIKEDIAKMRKSFKSVKHDFLFEHDSNEFTIDGKKVKIKKKIIIKVPKGATFNLNTRHSKVKLPDTNATGKVSYGSFDAIALNDSDLKVYSSSVSINRLNSTKLNLNNVTDAVLASVTKSKLITNSSDVKIDQVIEDFIVESSFGDILIKNLSPNIQNLTITLSQSDATIHTEELKESLKLVSSDKDYRKRVKANGNYTLNGKFSLASSNGSIKINGKYSDLTVVK